MSQPRLIISQEQGFTLVRFGTPVLDNAGVDAIAEQLTRLPDEAPQPAIVIDFSPVRFLASRMLGVLVDTARKAEAAGGRVVLCGLREDVGKVFKITRLDRVLAFAETVDNARDLFQAPE